LRGKKGKGTKRKIENDSHIISGMAVAKLPEKTFLIFALLVP
jgi:hypothetical protein